MSPIYKRWCKVCKDWYDSRWLDDDYPDEPWTDSYCSMKCYIIAKEKEDVKEKNRR